MSRPNIFFLELVPNIQIYCTSGQSDHDNPTFPRIKKWLISDIMYKSREILKFQSAREHPQ